jgi:S1-C subfamily serine protease
VEEPEEIPDDELPRGPLLPPDDRVWRHPTELAAATAPTAGPPPPAPDTHDRLSTWTIPLLSGLIGAVLTVGLLAVTGGLDSQGPVEREIVVTEREVAPFRPVEEPPEGSIINIADVTRPAIVRIEVAGSTGGGSGSGVVFRDNGYVLTNAHVVDDGVRITVSMSGGEELAGEVVGIDERTDIAVVKIEGDGPFPTALLGTAAGLRVGQRAVAIGSPLGLDGGPSVTVGYISALGRRVDSPGSEPLLDMIQTDAPIAPGSSGGALVDGSGSVIGITTAIAVSEVGAEGLGFATPIDIARTVAEDLIAHGRARHSWLGIVGTDIDRVTAQALDAVGGALVSKVYADSPAAKAGVRESDVILGVGDETIESMSELVVLLRRHRPGDVVSVRFAREGRMLSLSLVLAELPEHLPDDSEVE